MTMFKRFVKDESGATAIEYGLIAALIAVAIIGTLSVLGTQISAKFGAITTAINATNP
jgi:pilus assembly protein Flp/PilA